MRNYNCDGGHCKTDDGEVRVYPLGAGGNLILCRECWVYENDYHRERKWALENWIAAKTYPVND